MQLRKPAVAGSFYPAQPDRLRREIEELLAEAEPAPKITPKALIAPHAGYIYSGCPPPAHSQRYAIEHRLSHVSC